MLNPWNRTGKFALVALALMVLGVGACSTSTTTEVDMGKKMSIGLTAKTDADMITIDTGLSNFLDTQPGIENVSVSISEIQGGPKTIEVMAWGRDLDEEALVAELRRQVPELADADIGVETLSGTIEESLASKMKREIFQMEVDGATEEEIRAQILAQLAEQGVAEGDAQVQVIQEDGMTEIKVEVTKEVED
jgi:ABC-type phosphate/phosphonate transport system substrate-binding protein